MIVLDATTRSLELSLSGAVAATQLDYVCTWADHTTTSFVPAAGNGVSNGATPVTIAPAPAAAAQRQIKYISVNNTDSAIATATIKFNDNGTRRVLVSVSLRPTESLVYVARVGWRVLDVYGLTKQRVWARQRYMDDIVFPGTPHPSNGFTTSAGTLATGILAAVYLGVAARSYHSVNIGIDISTANATASNWWELGILKTDGGGLESSSGAAIATVSTRGTVAGWADASGIVALTGFQSVLVPLSGIRPGDHLMWAFSFAPTVNSAFIYRAIQTSIAEQSLMGRMWGNGQAGYTARLSTLPISFALQGQANQNIPWFLCRFNF